MSDNDGGSAFPQIETSYDGDSHEYTGHVYSSGGMTLRDYFAARVMQGIYAAGEGNGWDQNKERAERAYRQADAMLKAREA